MTRPTPQESIDRFVSTYTELYQDICKHSRQEHLPLTAWLLASDFKTTTSHQLDTNTKNPFENVKPLIEKHKPIAFVIGGKVAMVKRIISVNKSTKGKIDTELNGDKSLIEEVGKDIKNTSTDEVMNDPNKLEMLLIATSVLDIPYLEYGKPKVFKGSVIDKMMMYVIKRDPSIQGRDYVTLELEIDSNKNKIGNSSIVNVMGKRFGIGED